MLSYSFTGRTAVVVGGGSGIGRAIAIRFVDAGANVVVADVTEDMGRETVEMISKRGGEGEFVRADVCDANDVENMVKATVQKFGRVDFGCNAAAIDIEDEALADCKDETFDRVIAVNLRGTYLCMKHEIRQMLKQGGSAAIVNFASIAAYRTKGLFLNAYVASKQGVLGLSRVAAMRYAKNGIRINTVVPGAIDTPMLQATLQKRGITLDDLAASSGLLGRVGKPAEIAEAVLWLCSEYSSFTVGAAIPVDGGALIG
jgi:NAD(P)-dependent dehydrogenase (short-subunit alcohol dehydrogenase family)